MRYRYTIALDFDGTVVKHKYPYVGEDIGAVPILKRLVQNGHKIILYTMRSHFDEMSDTLQDAIDWFTNNGIPLFGINVNPTQKEWTSSPKVYADLYIDDNALGAPLTYDLEDMTRYIDWTAVAQHLFQMELLSEEDMNELIQNGEIHLEDIQNNY